MKRSTDDAAVLDRIELRHHDARSAREIVDHLAATYHDAYISTPQEHDPFYSTDRFTKRFNGYTAAPGFELVTAHMANELVGYVFGYALPQCARWWVGLIDPVSDSFTAETGCRTFAVNELHVTKSWRRRGIATQLHNELIHHRPEARATILVRPENPARATYIHWGYREIGRLKPFADSPTYDALVLDLREPEAGSP